MFIFQEGEVKYGILKFLKKFFGDKAENCLDLAVKVSHLNVIVKKRNNIS